MKDEVRTTKDEGGIVIGQDILDMMADAGKRHESLKSGHLRVIVRIEGGDVPKGEAGAWFTLEHYGVYADGQNFARYAKGLKSTDDIAAALREGFVVPREYKWKRASRAKKAADWVANFLPYAAMLAIGIMVSRCLFGEKTPDNLPESDPERAAQHLASEAVEVPHEPSPDRDDRTTAPSSERKGLESLAPLLGNDDGVGSVAAPFILLVQEATFDEVEHLRGRRVAKGIVVHDRFGQNLAENFNCLPVHADNSSTNAAKGAAR